MPPGFSLSLNECIVSGLPLRRFMVLCIPVALIGSTTRLYGRW